jgi:putative alpha-1,2-mannosidase
MFRRTLRDLLAFYGGNKPFVQKLDSLFTFTDNASENIDDIQGRLGEYCHGMSPVNHIIFLYDFAGRAMENPGAGPQDNPFALWNKPNSLSGNDDCGQMSAWYLFNAMGFYRGMPRNELLRHWKPGDL